MNFHPIGRIRTPHRTKTECPIQPVYAADAQGSVEVYEGYVDGLKDIELFSHIYLIYLFDRAGEVKLIRSPFLDDEPHGIYATRHPCRPNGIGLSIVRLQKRQSHTLIVSGVDMLDETPLLDIKPYVPTFDLIEHASSGWFDAKPWRPKPGNRE